MNENNPFEKSLQAVEKMGEVISFPERTTMTRIKLKELYDKRVEAQSIVMAAEPEKHSFEGSIAFAKAWDRYYKAFNAYEAALKEYVEVENG